MEWADILLHPAVSEGFCNSVIEAMSMGLPIVATDAGGLPENVKDGETGLIVPRRDPGAIAEALELLARNPALRQRMAEAGQHRVRRLFRLQDQVDAFIGFYDEVAGHPENNERTVPQGARSAG
jgi:colanic acid/amylovoran biosynthesis glycosyltransferase